MNILLRDGGRRRLAVAGFFMLIEATVVLVVALAVSLSSSSLRGSAQQSAQRTAAATEVTLLERVRMPLAAVDEASGNPALNQLLDRGGPGPDGELPQDSADDVLQGLVVGGVGFDRAFVTDPSGVVLAYWPSTNLIGVNLAREDWYTKAQGISQATVGRTASSAGAYFGTIESGAPAAPVFAPISNPGATAPQGYLVAVLGLAQIQSYVDSISAATGVSMTLIDSDGLFVARSRARLAIPSPIDFSLVRRALAGHSTFVQRASSPPLFSDYSPVRPLGWAVVVDLPAGEAFAAIASLQTTLVIIAAVLSLLLMVGAWISVGQVRRLQESALVRRQAEAMRSLIVAAAGLHGETGPALVDRIVASAKALTEADFGALLPPDEEAEWDPLYYAAAQSNEGLPSALTTSVTDLVRAQPSPTAPIRVADAASLRGSHSELGPIPAGPLLAMPLVRGESVVGILVLRRLPRRAPFDSMAEALVSELADHALTAIERARHESHLSADLETERERFRIAFHEGPIGMIILDTDLKPMLANRALAEMLGFSQDALGRTGWEENPLRGIEGWDLRDEARRLLRGEVASLQSEHRFLRPDGGWIWILIALSIVRDRRGAAAWLMAQFQDVTERRRLLELKVEVAIRESEAKDRFLATMSHELRTPLNAIMGFAQLLTRPNFGDLNDRQNRYVGHILSSSEHLLTLINEVLDLSKIRSGQVQINSERVLLLPLVEDLIARSGPTLEAKRLIIVHDIDPRLRVWADPLRLAQVIWNLVSNASKFTPSRGTIAIEAVETPGRVSILISDTGPGIPTEQLQRIFDDFTQVDSGPAREQQGTGLGLSICKRLVELMDGTITVESRMGMGSTFIVTLPDSSSVRLIQAAG